jgi:hypothetical protein
MEKWPKTAVLEGEGVAARVERREGVSEAKGTKRQERRSMVVRVGVL